MWIMKYVLVLVAMLVLCIGQIKAEAAMAVYIWDWPQTSASVTKFRLYAQENCTGAAITVDVPPLQPNGPFTQSFAFDGLKPATTYCGQASSIDASGKESARTNAVQFQMQTEPQMPLNLRIQQK